MLPRLLLFLGRIVRKLTRNQFRSFLFFESSKRALHVDLSKIKRCSKRFKLGFCLHLHLSLSARTESSSIFFSIQVIFKPNSLVKLSVIIVGFMEQDACIGKHFIAVIDS